ncbi:MAG TPA: dienelactone hydrolase family protein [Thermoanaerobaculia bacterium]|jgi:carboxymethylenebutenolidase
MCLGDDCDLESPERRAVLLGTGAAIVSLAAFGMPVCAQEPPPPTRVLDDPSILHGAVSFPRGTGTIDGYLARPKTKGRHRPVLVVAGNRITEEYIPNTCAALALAGFVALAPNIFHTVPDTAQTPDEIAKALEGRTEDDFLQDIQAGADYLESRPDVKHGPLGIIGFCSGGRRAMLYAARDARIKAVVPYHPARMAANEIAPVKAPVQIHCGTADRHVKVEWIRELEQWFRQQGTPVEVFLYEGADHGFLAYTRPYYRAKDAQLSWQRTTAFLRKHLR